MKKMFFLMLFILGISFNVFADTNYALTGIASFSATEGTVFGTASLSNDNNDTTITGVTDGDSVLAKINYVLTIDFGQVVPEINKVELISKTTVMGVPTFSTGNIQLCINDVWTTVKTSNFPNSKSTESQTGTWNDVSGIRFVVVAQSRENRMFPDPLITSAVYELRAWDLD